MRKVARSLIGIWLLFLWAALPGWAVESMPNLISNGSFESGTTSWTLTISDPQGAGNAASINDALSLAGTADLRMDLYNEGSVTAESASCAVSSGYDYHLTCWYQAQGFDAAASYTVKWYDGGGGLISSASADITSAAQTAWTKVTRTVTAPANAATAKVSFVTTASLGCSDSFFFLDNVKFARCVSLLPNGSVEGGLASWTTSVTGTGNTITADTGEPQADLQALKIDMPNEGSASATSAAIAVNAGQDYFLALWFKSTGFGTGVSAAYECTWYDGGGGTISTASTAFPGSAQSTWTYYAPLRLPAPANAATAKIRLVMTTQAGSAASTAWVDGVEFTADANLAYNGSFEGGLTAWTTDVTGGGAVSADTAQHQDGSQSLKLDLPTPGSASATSTAVTVSGGRDFLLTFWYRTAGANGSETPAVDVKWFNGGGSEITPASHIALPTGEQLNWTSVTRRVSPPSGAASAKVVCGVSSTAAGAYALWCDALFFSQDPNLISNGGYEGGLTGWGTSTSGTGSSVSIDTTQHYEDLASVKLSVPNPSSSATLSMSNFVPVSAGKEYEISVMFRSEGFSDNGGYDNVASSYTIYYFNASQQQISSQGIGFPYTAQSTWRQWRRVVLMPANTAYIKIYCSISAYTDTLPSSIWLDKFEVIPYDTRLKVGGGSWMFRVADLGKYNKAYFRRGADDNTSTGAAVIANPNFGTTPNYIAYAFYSTAVTLGQHRAVFRMKVGDVSVTRNVASLDVNTANNGLINVTPYTTDYFGQANVYKNLILRFRKTDPAWVDFRAYWQAQVRTAVDTVTIYEEEVDD
ncbi:MAG: hypothetical protein ACYC7E_08045 [Armatimonadota bacterium]